MFHLDFKTGKPAYLQLVDQVRYAAASVVLRPGEPLPSVRQFTLPTKNPFSRWILGSTTMQLSIELKIKAGRQKKPTSEQWNFSTVWSPSK